MENIKIKNLRNERPSQPWQIRVDRASVLGNPFHMVTESQRAEVCDSYKHYFRQSLVKTQAIINEMTRLLNTYRKYGKLELFCWCAPKQCHAETIKECIENAITMFRGEYAFLSNMYPCTITIGKYTFKNAEAAFQACKCPSRAHEFEHLDGPAAKKLGRAVPLREDWDEKRVKFMHRILKAKFTQNLELMKKLIHTKNAWLVECNTWGDTFWGCCEGVGHNHLGRLLMRVRKEIYIDAYKEEN